MMNSTECNMDNWTLYSRTPNKFHFKNSVLNRMVMCDYAGKEPVFEVYMLTPFMTKDMRWEAIMKFYGILELEDAIGYCNGTSVLNDRFIA